MKTFIPEAVFSALAAGTLLLPITMPNGARAASLPTISVQFESIRIDGLNIAYREAGDPEKPTILLLHGFPTSSHMFRNLIPVLAESYHVIAPDYPGFGASDMPDAATYEYSFANTAEIITELLDDKGIDK